MAREKRSGKIGQTTLKRWIMGSNNQTRYIDADKLKEALASMYADSGTKYTNGQIESQINQMISGAIMISLEAFKHQIIDAIDKASVPYDKCMLCVQRDSCIPQHPLGEKP
jgi:hypothetical protein